MSPSQFGKRLGEVGFEQFAHPSNYRHAYRRSKDGRSECVILDSVRNGAFRFFLGWNCIPQSPRPASIANSEIEAESPWFEYVEADERSEALDRAWDWLSTTGFEFLADPHRKQLHLWVSDDRMLVRDEGTIIPVPSVRRLP